MDAPDGCPSPSDIAANSLLRETLRTFATWCLTVTGSPWLGPRCASGHDSIRTKPPLPHQPAPCTASPFRVMRDRHRIFGRRGGRMKRREIFLFMFLPPPPRHMQGPGKTCYPCPSWPGSYQTRCLTRPTTGCASAGAIILIVPISGSQGADAGSL